MDNSYGGSDETVLRATPSHHHTPYIDTLLITPSIGANMQLSHGLYEAASRVKCEDMASGLTGMISWATASQLYENIQFSDTLRSKSHSTACDLWLRSAPMPLCVPAFDTMDFVASNPFQFLSTSEHMVPSMDTSSISSTRSDKGLQLYEPEADFKPAKNPGATSRLSKSMVQALELQNAQTGKYLGPSFLSTTTTLLKPSAECIPASSHTHPIIPSDISPDMVASLSDSPNSPSKQDSSVLSAEDSDADRTKIQSQSSKRRKTQQKRIVCVPIGDGKQKVEAPPSDLWAWRKYGQKPIKGSPYPRGYYRCSSSKGCSARKQVERSCTDPTMLIVTYTSDHDHPWPANRSMKSVIGPKPSQSGDKCQGQAEEAANSCEVACENLFSSIINSPNAVNEQVVSPLDSLQDEESFSLHRDVDLRFLSRTTTEEDDVFDDLGELPNLSAIFNKGYLEEKLMDDGCEQYGFL